MVETDSYLLMLSYITYKNISVQRKRNFTIKNMKKSRMKRKGKFFSVNFNPIDTNVILDIHRFLMKET